MMEEFRTLTNMSEAQLDSFMTRLQSMPEVNAAAEIGAILEVLILGALDLVAALPPPIGASEAGMIFGAAFCTWVAEVDWDDAEPFIGRDASDADDAMLEKIEADLDETSVLHHAPVAVIMATVKRVQEDAAFLGRPAQAALAVSLLRQLPDWLPARLCA